MSQSEVRSPARQVQLPPGSGRARHGSRRSSARRDDAPVRPRPSRARGSDDHHADVFAPVVEADHLRVAGLSVGDLLGRLHGGDGVESGPVDPERLIRGPVLGERGEANARGGRRRWRGRERCSRRPTPGGRISGILPCVASRAQRLMAARLRSGTLEKAITATVSVEADRTASTKSGRRRDGVVEPGPVGHAPIGLRATAAACQKGTAAYPACSGSRCASGSVLEHRRNLAGGLAARAAKEEAAGGGDGERGVDHVAAGGGEFPMKPGGEGIRNWDAGDPGDRPHAEGYPLCAQMTSQRRRRGPSGPGVDKASEW